jgi:hypothetical protein
MDLEGNSSSCFLYALPRMRAQADIAAGKPIISKDKNYNQVFSDSIRYNSLYVYMLSSIANGQLQSWYGYKQQQ